MSELSDLYQEVILDHNKRPRNFHRMEQPSRHADGHNPLCGDRVTIYLDIEDGRVRDVSFEGSGCAISKASASMMTEAIKGRSLDEVETLFRSFHGLVTGQEPAAEGDLGKLVVFSGVREFPARVKCASLAWHTMHAALENASETTTTE